MKKEISVQHDKIKSVLFNGTEKSLRLVFNEKENPMLLYRIITGFKKSAETGGQPMLFTLNRDEKSIYFVGRLDIVMNFLEFRGVLDEKMIVKIRQDRDAQNIITRSVPLYERMGNIAVESVAKTSGEIFEKSDEKEKYLDYVISRIKSLKKETLNLKGSEEKVSVSGQFFK